MENFDDIRAYRESDYQEVTQRLWNDPELLHLLDNAPLIGSAQQVRDFALSFNNLDDFLHGFIHYFLNFMRNKTVSSFEAIGFDRLDKSASYLYISNHRDIIMDTAFLNLILFDQKFSPCETAIGDNLLIRPWIKDLVRQCQCFIVKRNLPVKEQLLASKELSSYIREAICQRKQSIWMAQREGRAKNSDDRTQKSVLKMLNLSGESNILENLTSLHIVPLTISYEYDPCDYLKAKELLLRRDVPDFKKTQEDDLLSMKTGMMGSKGRVCYCVDTCIDNDFFKMDTTMLKNDLVEKFADFINLKIHTNYRLYPNNYAAIDLLDGTDAFTNYYTEAERNHFDEYLQQQLDKIDLPRAQKDEKFLRTSILEMYANPAKNKRKAKNNHEA